MLKQTSKPFDKSSAEGDAALRTANAEPTNISADLKVVGDLNSSGDIQIKGTVEGDVRSRTVTVGEGAHVEGSLYGDSVKILGSVKGHIEATMVTVAKSAKILGDIVHENLSVEAGAFLEGQCRHLDSKKASEPPGISTLKTSAPNEPSAEGKRVIAGSGS